MESLGASVLMTLHHLGVGSVQVVEGKPFSFDLPGTTANAVAAITTVLEAPLYFLNLWMPACALMLDAATGSAGSTLVTRLAANGEVCGLQLAGLPGRWFSAPAAPVCGPFMKGAPDNPHFPPATGDSGIIDAFGLGGQVLRRAPSLQAAFQPWLAADDDAPRRSRLRAGVVAHEDDAQRKLGMV